MRRFLISAVVIGASVVGAGPVEAKSIWLSCDGTEINLDSGKERFSLTSGSEIVQGKAIFNPGQINFEYLVGDFGGGDGIKDAYVINRKTLAYSKSSMMKFLTSTWKPSGTEKTGKCKIMKTPPTAGNKI